MSSILRIILLLTCCANAFGAGAQKSLALADSLRMAYSVPEIGYAVITADSILELEVIGLRQAGSDRQATHDDRFRIGSNTKTVTSFIAAALVHRGIIGWGTRFFDLFPELKAGSNIAYHQLDLLDLLTFRAQLIPYTYTDPEPATTQFMGDADAQRTAFIAWALQQEPAATVDGIRFSNVAYVLAGAMLEHVTNKPFGQLVEELCAPMDVHFQFGAPNHTDSLATWGHRADGTAEASADDRKLEWLMAAGNLNVSLPDFATLMQEHLKGLQGRSSLLSKEEFQYLHTGSPTWALGWKWSADPDDGVISFHIGNPGAFLTEVFVHHTSGRAYILFANRQSPGTQAALDALYAELMRKYER